MCALNAPSRVAAALALAVGGLGGCAAGEPDLAGRTFTSTQVRGHDLVAGTAITLAFGDADISARAGCNTLAGGANWGAGKLTIEGQLAATLMACDQPLMDQDTWLASFLQSSPALALDDGVLELGDQATGITLVEEP